MTGLIRTYHTIDAINRKVGLTVAWLALGMVVAQFCVVVSRYVFSVGSIPVQESIWYMHGSLFMLGAGYTLLRDGHVRVDVFYRDGSDRRRAWIDLLGILLFLLPVCVFIFYTSWGYVVNAWKVLEGSTETNGIPAIFALKAVIPVAITLLALQGLSMLLRCIVVIGGRSATAGETPDETGTIEPVASADRKTVLGLTAFLLPIEFFTLLIGLAHTGWVLALVRVALVAVALLLAYGGSRAGRIVFILVMFVAAGYSLQFAAVASGDPGAMMTILTYGNIVAALAVAFVPWSGDTTDIAKATAKRGFPIVLAVALYVIATEFAWFIDRLLANNKGSIVFTDLPRWAVPAMLRIGLVAMVVAAFLSGSRVARSALVVLLLAAAAYSVYQTASAGALPLIGFGSVIVGVLHVLVAVYIARNAAIGEYLDAQAAAGRTIAPDRPAS